MMQRIILIGILFLIISCKTTQPKVVKENENPTNTQTETVEHSNIHESDFTIAFGSCNDQKKENPFWGQISKHSPDVWIWGGDIIYCDTENMDTLAKCYQTQKNNPAYKKFIKTTDVIGVWDDHDYGVNDGGEEYIKKKASQDLFLDFFDVLCLDERRSQKGTYHSEVYEIGKKKVKIILLDTRYFRTALTKDNETHKRYKPNNYGEGTILGEAQWDWLENELSHSKADYHIINSSIQFLSNQHGYESWGNMPHEVDNFEDMIVKTKAKNVIFISGDRHISEVSVKEIRKIKYPLIDFTSSGLTHAYTGFKSEENPYRVSKVIHQKSYGLIKFDFDAKKISFEMWGENNSLLDSYLAQF